MNPNDNKPGQPQQPQSEMGFDKYVAITLVVGLIAGFIIGHSVGSAGKDKDTNSASSTGSKMIFGDQEEEDAKMESKSSMSNSEEGIELSDQTAGNTVIISKLSTNEAYWVAVRDSQSTTKTPYILGAKRVAAGNYSDLSIYVNRATVQGNKYDIVFYKDGATFNYDPAMIVSNGSTVAAATFEAK